MRSDALRACGNPDRWSKHRIDLCRHPALSAHSFARFRRASRTRRACWLYFRRVIPTSTQHYTPKTKPEDFLPFRTGFASIAAVAEKRLGAKVPMVPTGFHYTKDSRWTARLNIGEAVYLEDFASRRLLVSYMEQRVAELSESVNLNLSERREGSQLENDDPAVHCSFAY